MGQKTMNGVTTLGQYMIKRREELGLSQSGAARATKIGYDVAIARSTWVNWEKDVKVPERFNYVRIEKVLRWKPGSVEGALDGRDPVPLPQDHSPPDDVEAMLDELGIDRRKWRRVDELTRQNLINAYRLAKARREKDAAGA